MKGVTMKIDFDENIRALLKEPDITTRAGTLLKYGGSIRGFIERWSPYYLGHTLGVGPKTVVGIMRHIGDAYVLYWWPELTDHHLDAEQIYQLCVDSKR